MADLASEGHASIADDFLPNAAARTPSGGETLQVRMERAEAAYQRRPSCLRPVPGG
jgi:hypothetical protein